MEVGYDIIVVGAGPAGMMAADHAAQRGLRVAIVEQMPSPARKFLMAGQTDWVPTVLLKTCAIG